MLSHTMSIRINQFNYIVKALKFLVINIKESYFLLI